MALKTSFLVGLFLLVTSSLVNAQNNEDLEVRLRQEEAASIESLSRNLPSRFSFPINYLDEVMTLQLEKSSVYGKNTRFLVDDGSGKLVKIENPKECAYTGCVKEHSRYTVSAVVTEKGLLATIVKPNGEKIEVKSLIDESKHFNDISDEELIDEKNRLTFFSMTSNHNLGSVKRESTASLAPTQVMDVLEYEIGVEIGSLSFFGSAYNGDLATAQASAQSIIGNLNRRFLHASGVKFVLGTVIIRTDADTDPLRSIGGNGNSVPLLTAFKDYWNNHPEEVGATHDLAVYHVKAAPSGLSWVNSLGTSRKYAMMGGNGATSWADGTAVHEVGHSFNLRHVSDEKFLYENRPRVNAGSSTEGGRDYFISVMHGSGNHNIGRFATGEARVVRATLNAKRSLGTPPTDPGRIRPFGVYDEYELKSAEPLTLDVVANDYDMNNDVLDVRLLDKISFLGGTISLSEGTGPGGRNEIVYTEPESGLNGKDFFHYTVFDSTGLSDFGAVYVYKETSLFTSQSEQFRFDFGTQTSKVWPDYDRVYSKTSNELYGWVNSPNLSDRDRGTQSGANDLNRDLCHSSEPALFEVNLRNGRWEVLVTFGDTYAHDVMYVKAEGIDKLENISNVPKVYFNEKFEIDVSDGKLSLEFSDRGGSDVNWAVTRVILTYVEASSVAENDAGEAFSFYPNPTNAVIHIKRKTKQGVLMKIYDAMGKTMYMNEHFKGDVISVNGWSRGVYLLVCKYGDNEYSKKIIVN